MLAELVIAHDERAVVRVGDAYIKADVDAQRLDREVAALLSVDVPRPKVLWHRRSAVSLVALSETPGVPLASLGAPSPHPDAIWAMAGQIARRVHDAQVPESLAAPSEYRSEDLDLLEEWLLSKRLADPRLISEHVARARAVRDSATNDCLIHGDFQPAHVLVDDGWISGVIDWADAGTGDRHYDLAVLTAGHSEHPRCRRRRIRQRGRSKPHQGLLVVAASRIHSLDGRARLRMPPAASKLSPIRTRSNETPYRSAVGQ